MGYRIFFFAAIVLGVSCSKQKNEIGNIPTIKVNVDKVACNYDLAQDVESEFDIVPLETKPECLIGTIEDIQYANNSYYILTGQGSEIYRFSASGQFQSSLKKKGNGPNEYLKISSFLVEGNNIWIYDPFSSHLSCYNQSQEKIESIDTGGSIGWCYALALINNAIYMFNDWTCGKESCYQLGIYDLKSRKLTFREPFRPLNDTILKRVMKMKLSQTNGVYTAAYTYCDTLFSIGDKELKPQYRFSFSDRMKNTPMAREELLKKEHKDFIEGIIELQQTKKSIMLVYADKGQFRYAIYDKINHTTNVYENLINTNLGGLALNEPVFLDRNIILSKYPDTKIFKMFVNQAIKKGKFKDSLMLDKFKVVLSTLKEDANPVIIKYKLKAVSNL